MSSCRFLKNGIKVALRPAAPPGPGRYVRQLIHKNKNKGGHGTCLPWYYTSPSQGLPEKASRCGHHQGTVFGPIHDVEDSWPFISVKVPTPKVALLQNEHLPELVRINIYTENHYCGEGFGHHYCEVVSEDEVQSWKSQGWTNFWIEADGPQSL